MRSHGWEQSCFGSRGKGGDRRTLSPAAPKGTAPREQSLRGHIRWSGSRSRHLLPGSLEALGESPPQSPLFDTCPDPQAKSVPVPRGLNCHFAIGKNPGSRSSSRSRITIIMESKKFFQHSPKKPCAYEWSLPLSPRQLTFFLSLWICLVWTVRVNGTVQ